MSISDIFGNLEIEDSEEIKVKWCPPDQYKPTIHQESWFTSPSANELVVDQREIYYNRSCYQYHKKDFSAALKAISEWRSSGDHRGAFLVQVVDSTLRAALKDPSTTSQTLMSLLSELDRITTCYGDQLQLWNVQKRVFCRLGLSHSLPFLRSVILLCSTISLPEHWLYFGDMPDLKIGPNFRPAFLARAILLLEPQPSQYMGCGFVSEKLERDLKRTRTLLEEYPQEVRDRAFKEMCLDPNQSRHSKDEDMSRPAHDCKSKIGVFKTPEMCDQMESEFRQSFSWMFEGM